MSPYTMSHRRVKKALARVKATLVKIVQRVKGK